MMLIPRSGNDALMLLPRPGQDANDLYCLNKKIDSFLNKKSSASIARGDTAS